ncbi:unnamed protein product [Adineta ricciae]|uniref:Lsm14-like N-terminal domain-containing protein n=1 Tax=Adineta ricciae TaxID=249248 RepID=A0A813TW59_ADIRI|nr:unnamed protein product [Adineta ricciae]
MQLQEQYLCDTNSITHSPYYGCTVRVVSKAQVSYEGVLDGINTEKNRIFLKNVRVKGSSMDLPDRINSIEESDTANTVMIDHLTNDMRIYEQVCLNVRDIQELNLIRLPATFHESQAKLRSIDPCLLDIRLSPTDEQGNQSEEYTQPIPITRRVRGESLGSMGGGPLASSSSNESTSSCGYRPNESCFDSFDEQCENFSRLSTSPVTQNPPTLLAKKVLAKKIERNTIPSLVPETRPTDHPTILKIVPLNNQRKPSPIRVTITSKLNPNATPFYGQEQKRPTHQPNQNSSFKFYAHSRFQPRSQLQNRSQQGNQPVPYPHQHQRFVPPRQMAIKKKFNNQTPPSVNKRPQQQQQQQQHQNRHKAASHEQIPGLMQPLPSSIMDQILTRPPLRERLSVPNYNRHNQSPVNLHPTSSLPYQYGIIGDSNQLQVPSSFVEPIGSHRGPRTVSGTSSASSMSIEIGPHSIAQLDSSSNALISPDGPYDFEKANEEFRRYLELEELVTRHASSAGPTGSHANEQSNSPQSQNHSYKKEISFFDRISCTATTGTAVAYTEMDADEKNLETFGDDALRLVAEIDNEEW